ncbi:MAG: hypothetical protein Tsb009_00260 [Planctomycetaceae bacterium]
MTDSVEISPSIRRTKRGITVAFCVGYVMVSLWFGVRHLLGDSSSHPTADFFTWDMFPGYATVSSRRFFLGKTESGKVVRLLPDPASQFRWGIFGTVRRLDVDKRTATFLPALERRISIYNRDHAKDRIQRVTIVEQFWPAKFNLDDELYESTYGQRHPHRKYWRVVDTAAVNPDGTLQKQRAISESDDNSS